jgi:hypothetical protein
VQTVTVTLSGTAVYIAAGAIAMSGAHQTVPTNDVPTTTFGTSGTATINATTATGELICDLVVVGGAVTLTAGANQTPRWTQNGDRTVGSSTQAGADGVVMSWTFTSDDWILGAASFKPAAGTSISPPAGAPALQGVAGLLDLGVHVPIGRR